MGQFLNTAEPFDAWGRKAEEMLVDNFPQMIDGGHFDKIHIGRNTDSGVGDRGGFRVRGNNATMQNALYFEAPERMIGEGMLANEVSKKQTFNRRVADSVMNHAVAAVNEMVSKGIDKKEAQKRVADSVAKYGYFDTKTSQFISESVVRRVNDSVLSGMMTPHWDIAVIQKIFKQPFLRGYADGMVSKLGIPNIWADLVQIFTESFEGKARVSNVAKTMQTFNTSIAAKNRTGTMLSQLINIVIDYESPQIQEMAIGNMPGNWLTNAVIGDRDAYANLMLEQLMNVLWYFGHPETGFEGLTQIAQRDGTVTQFAGRPADRLWAQEAAGTNTLVGAQLLIQLSHMMADRMEEMQWLPVDVKWRVSPILYKVLKFSQLSQVYNQNNPLSIIDKVYESGNKLVGTLVSRSGNAGWQNFEICPDPMLAANTPFNRNPWDLAFMTFPSIQSQLDGGMDDLVMAPMPIDKMILPSAPGYRDGVVRTALKRIGSILAPVEKTVHRIEGMGTNTWFVGP